MNLGALFSRSAELHPTRPALRHRGEEVRYVELDRLINQLARFMTERGVGRGSRVALWLDKSPRAVAVMLATLRVGAAYIPLDPLAPALRVRSLLESSAPRLLVTSQSRWSPLESTVSGCLVVLVDGAARDERSETWRAVEDCDAQPFANVTCHGDGLAYILFTSGSTGEPKGVCLSHQNALSFIKWAAETFEPSSGDRFANHAPLHFDLSVLDLYLAFSVGACTVLLDDQEAYLPDALVQCLVGERITVWYSVPSALILMMRHGQLLDTELPALRLVLFAGEAFPLPPLRELMQHLPVVTFWNLFGPTETNVCTAHRVEANDTTLPALPIGRAASFAKVWVVKDDGNVGAAGEAGELFVDGPTVMLGYWGAENPACKPYATGDHVLMNADGTLSHLGRRDGMLKCRGQRISPREIECVLELHEAVEQACVVQRGRDADSRLVAALVVRTPVSLLAIKRHSARYLPRAMIVDSVCRLNALPTNRNGKVDRVTVEAIVREHVRQVSHAADSAASFRETRGGLHDGR